jgi:hypothetical protein
MVAGAFGAAYLPVDAGRNQPFRGRTIKQEVVQTQARVPLPAMPQIMPKRIHRLVRVQRAEGVRPALLQKTPEAGAWLGLDQRVLRP